MSRARGGLPYIDNVWAVLITIAVNLACVFAFEYPTGIEFREAMWYSLFMGALTAVFDTAIVYVQMKKLRAAGALPMHPPTSPLMQRLPSHPVALGAIYAVAFAAVSLGLNWAILSFFGIRQMVFVEWAVYNLVFVTLLSAKIVEYCVFRYVQPDWAGEGARAEAPESVVRDPLPRFMMFKAVYASVTGNLALNFILGSLTGSIGLGEGNAVIVAPVTVDSIHITGLVFGLISGVLISNGVIKAMEERILQAPMAVEAGEARWSWLPKRRASLTVLVCAGNMVLSALALRGVLELFNLPVLDFYRYTVLMTAYAAAASKVISALLVRRCSRADYVVYVQRKGVPQCSSV